jgi:hypothetical protein
MALGMTFVKLRMTKWNYGFRIVVNYKIYQTSAQYKRSLRMSKFNHAAISSEFFMLVSLSQTKGKGKHKNSHKETNGILASNEGKG